MLGIVHILVIISDLEEVSTLSYTSQCPSYALDPVCPDPKTHPMSLMPSVFLCSLLKNILGFSFTLK